MYSRPIGRVTINRSSPQINGLVFWMPMLDVFLEDRKGKLAIALGGGALSIVTDETRMGFNFGGTSEYYKTTTTPITGFPLTFACWFKLNNVSATRSLINISTSADANNYQSLQVSTTTLRMRSSDSTNFSSANATGTLASATWYHAAGTVSAANSRACFLNGGGKGTQSTSRTPNSATQIGIGCLLTSTTASFMAGTLADIRIYNRVLTDAEIAALYNPQTRWDLYEPIFKIFVPTQAPASYNNSLTLATVQTVAPVSRLDVAGNITLSTVQTAVDGGLFSAVPTLSLGTVQSLTPASVQSVLNTLTLNAVQALTTTALYDGSVSLTLNAVQALTDTAIYDGSVAVSLDTLHAVALAGALNAINQVSLSASVAANVQSVADLLASLSLDTGQAVTDTAVYDGGVSVALDTGQAVTDTAVYNGNVSVVLATAQALVATSLIDVLGSSTLNVNLTLETSLTGPIVLTLSLGIAAGLTPLSVADSLGSLIVDTALGLNTQAQENVNASLGLAATLTITSSGLASQTATLELPAGLALLLSTGGVQNVDGSVLLAQALSTDLVSTLGVVGSFEVNVAQTVALTGFLTALRTLSLSMVPGLGLKGSVFSVNVVTPDGRKFMVTFKLRLVQPQVETRVFQVPVGQQRIVQVAQGQRYWQVRPRLRRV